MLPTKCYRLHPYSGEKVMIEVGKEGFKPIESALSVNKLNATLDPMPTPEQIEAMTVGSMFGWDVPGAKM